MQTQDSKSFAIHSSHRIVNITEIHIFSYSLFISLYICISKKGGVNGETVILQSKSLIGHKDALCPSPYTENAPTVLGGRGEAREAYSPLIFIFY